MTESSKSDEGFVERLYLFIGTVYGKPIRFAEEIGVHSGMISRYLSGESAPTLKILLQFEESGGVSSSWLLTGKGDMFSATDKGRELRKIHVGKELPQTVGEVLGADEREAMRQRLSEVMQILGGSNGSI